MPNKQIADALSVTEGTVKQHLHRALEALAIALHEDAEENA